MSLSRRLSLSLGKSIPDTGMPNLAGPYDPTNGTPTTTPDPDVLMASTYGQGEFAINLAPLVFPNTVKVDPSSVNSRRNRDDRQRPRSTASARSRASATPPGSRSST